MFETNYRNSLPGYTGHVPGKIENDAPPENKEARKHIPGYGGYVPGVKSENVFGQTYGKTSYQSSAGVFHRGIDEPANLKYQSLFKAEYVQHSQQQHETTAQIVGVQRQQDSYKKPIPPETVYKFFGVSTKEADDVVQNQQFEKNKSTFFGVTNDKTMSQAKPNQSEEDALKVFYGVEEPRNQAPKNGDPIPGYSGVNRRVQADNVFGMTYAEARRRAQDSQNRITQEKGDTLRQTSQFVPEYKRPKQDDLWY